MEAKIQRLLEAAKNAHGLMLDKLSTAELDYFGVNELGDAIRAVEEPPVAVDWGEALAETVEQFIAAGRFTVVEHDTAVGPPPALGPPVNTMPPDFVDNDHDGLA